MSYDVIGMTPQECVSRREALNHLKLKSLPLEPTYNQSFQDKTARRTARTFNERGVVSLGGPTPLTPGRRSSAQVSVILSS